MPGLGGPLEGRVRIRRRGLRERIAGLLSEALANMSDEDRRLVLARLKRVVSRSSKAPPESTPPAHVRRLDEGGFEMVIEPRAFGLYDHDHRQQLAIIEHELDELVRMAREGGIHELEFFFLSAREVEGLKAKCIICGEEVSEGYGIISDIIDEKGGAYVERLCDGLGMGPEALFKALFVCVGCMFECCSPCERYDACRKTRPDLSCRCSERWVERAISVHDRYGR